MTRCKGTTKKGTVCKKSARTNRPYCKTHNYVNMESPEYIPTRESKPKSYTQENINKIKKLQILYRNQKKKKDAVRIITKYRQQKLKQNMFKSLQKARKTYRQTHNTLNVKRQPLNSLKIPLTKPAQPKITVTTQKFLPTYKVGSFYNEKGKIMKTPIQYNELKHYYNKNNLHPINWQKFGKRPTSFKIQTYSEHMKEYALQNLPNHEKQIRSKIECSIQNNKNARNYVTNLFNPSKSMTDLSFYSKRQMFTELLKIEKNIKEGEEKNIYFQYKTNPISFNLKNVSRNDIYKINKELVHIHPINQKTVVVTRLKIIKKNEPARYTMTQYYPAYLKSYYVVYYGKSERAKFESATPFY